MKTRVKIIKEGVDHVEVEVADETAADLVADEAHMADIKPVIGQRQERALTGQHYVVLHGVARDVMKFLAQNSKIELIAS